MPTEPGPTGGQSPDPASDPNFARALLLEHSESQMRTLIDGALAKGCSPQLVELLKVFQNELQATATRSVEDFASLPSVQNAMAAWMDAGLPKNDFMFMLVDLHVLQDARLRYFHSDMTKMVGLTGGAVLAVAQVFAATIEEAMKARKELTALRMAVEAVAQMNGSLLDTLPKVTSTMTAMNQNSYELALLMGRHTWKGKLWLLLGCAAGGSLIFGIGLLIGLIAGR